MISVSIALGFISFGFTFLISYSDIMCFRLPLEMHEEGIRVLPFGDGGGGNLEALRFAGGGMRDESLLAFAGTWYSVLFFRFYDVF